MPLPLPRAALLSHLLLAAPVALAAAPGATRLEVDVTGLPDGVAADVVLTGPGDVRRALTGDAALDDLAPGAYVLTPAELRGAGTFADVLYEGEAVRAVVSAGKPAKAVVKYRIRPGTGMLWVASPNDRAVHGFGNAQLGAGGRQAGSKIGDAGSRYVRGLAFDARGDLWASGDCHGELVKLAADQLAGSGARRPTAVLTPAGSGRCLDGIAFGRDGRLWVADRASGELLAFGPALLRKGGKVQAEVVIGAPDRARPVLRNPCGVAFDAQGNLWVSNTDGGDTVVMYSPDQLGASGRPAPRVVLKTTATSLRSPRGLAFDARGNLWVANRYGPVVKFTPDQLEASGTPTPAATLPVDAISGQTDLVGLALDDEGGVWVANRVNPPRVVGWRAADLEKRGARPATTLDGGFATPGHLVFQLTPARR